jgi:hypothetical protein
MIIRARVDGRVFIPEQRVDLPEGSIVEIPIAPPSEPTPLAKLAEIADMFPEDPDYPPDGAAQHDHYFYGLPKRP